MGFWKVILLGRGGSTKGLWSFWAVRYFVDKSEDWYSDLSGGGVFGDWIYFDLDFGFGFAVVERFDIGYFEGGMVFECGCFEEEVEFGRMRKHNGDFRLSGL